MRAVPTPEALWVFFACGDIETARALLALPGAVLYAPGGEWKPLGHALPAFDVPDPGEGSELSRFVFPAPAIPREATDDWRPVTATLVRSGREQRTTALCVKLRDLVAWATMATRHDLAGFRCATDGANAVLVGERLPPLVGEAFWGHGLLVAAGCRPDPALPLRVLGEAFGLGPGEIALWRLTGLEVIPDGALDGVSLARLRLALEAA